MTPLQVTITRSMVVVKALTITLKFKEITTLSPLLKVCHPSQERHKSRSKCFHVLCAQMLKIND